MASPDRPSPFSGLWDDQAATYDARTAWLERRFLGPPRAEVCGAAVGDVLELGVGTGANLPHYPADVTLTALDFSAAMLAQAERRAGSLGLPQQTVLAEAGTLPFAAASFDTVVATYLLCSASSVDQTLGEIWRVLRPGGRVLLADHVEPGNRVLRAGARWLERRTATRYGEHFTRRPLLHLEAAGFTVVSSQRRGFIERVHAERLG